MKIFGGLLQAVFFWPCMRRVQRGAEHQGGQGREGGGFARQFVLLEIM